MASSYGRVFHQRFGTALFNRKLTNFRHIDNGEKYQGVLYSQQEIEQAVLCPKGVDWDIYLTPYFARFYKEAYFVGLIRNGHAWCNGWLRRGKSAANAGRTYHQIGQLMIDYQLSYGNRYTIVKFEDVINNPFQMANQMFSFAGLTPSKLDKLRLKSKRVVDKSGRHTARFGEVDRKYWFDQQQIHQFINPRINETQMNLLKDRDRLAFEKHANPILEYFGYRQ